MMCVHMCARVYIYMHIVYSCRFYSETKREINVIENNKSNSDIISKYIFLFYEISMILDFVRFMDNLFPIPIFRFFLFYYEQMINIDK